MRFNARQMKLTDRLKKAENKHKKLKNKSDCKKRASLQKKVLKFIHNFVQHKTHDVANSQTYHARENITYAVEFDNVAKEVKLRNCTEKDNSFSNKNHEESTQCEKTSSHKEKNEQKLQNTALILNNMSFKIKSTKITVLLGKSGAGKTTVARIINGLEDYSQGTVTINETILTNKTQKKIRKHTAFVFQDLNLFPHMSVIENIVYTPINVYKMDRAFIMKKAYDLLYRFKIDKKSNSYPHELSGGQKQRVAIIRALILNPSILIMDEPTASLDPELTHNVIDIIKQINKTGLTVIVITHDMNVVKKAADEVLMLANGKCVDSMSKKDFFNPRIKKSFYSRKFLQNCL